jgi:hypothetical protein
LTVYRLYAFSRYAEATLVNWTLGYMGKGDQSARGEFLRDTGETDFSFSIEALKRLIRQGRTPKLYRDELFLNKLSNELNRLSDPSKQGREAILNIIGKDLVSKTDQSSKTIDSLLSSKVFHTDNEKHQFETVEQLTELLTELGIYDNIVDADITNDLVKDNIEKIDSSFSVDDVESLIEEVLTPLFIRAELSADQKAKIVYASSMTFKACIDSNNGLANGDDKVSSFDANVVTVALPSEAPATWKADKLAGDTPPEFIKRVYAKWLGNGLTIADLRKLDPSLVRALAHHEKQGRLIPDGFDLPPGKRGPKIETGDSISPEVNDFQGVLRTYWRERQNQARAKRRDNEPGDGRGR